MGKRTPVAGYHFDICFCRSGLSRNNSDLRRIVFVRISGNIGVVSFYFETILFNFIYDVCLGEVL